MSEPFLPPEHRAQMDGQQYVVLRPVAAVRDAFRTIQAEARLLAPAPLPAPLAGHVTLRGFREPDRVDQVRTAVRIWAGRQAPIFLRVDAVDVFPAPWQIPILHLERTAQLVEAYSRLTHTLAPTGLHRLDERDLEDWTFHLSLVYARDLPPEDWATLTTCVRMLDPRPEETVHEAEIIWYTDGVEHRETYPLGGG